MLAFGYTPCGASGLILLQAGQLLCFMLPLCVNNTCAELKALKCCKSGHDTANTEGGASEGIKYLVP